MSFVLIVSDTFRQDHPRCYGNPRIRAPHLDRFALEHTRRWVATMRSAMERRYGGQREGAER